MRPDLHCRPDPFQCTSRRQLRTQRLAELNSAARDPRLRQPRRVNGKGLVVSPSSPGGHSCECFRSRTRDLLSHSSATCIFSFQKRTPASCVANSNQSDHSPGFEMSGPYCGGQLASGRTHGTLFPVRRGSLRVGFPSRGVSQGVERVRLNPAMHSGPLTTRHQPEP